MHNLTRNVKCYNNFQKKKKNKQTEKVQLGVQIFIKQEAENMKYKEKKVIN